jgi:DNA (cytosine-5)-methyltransferase 1
VTAIDHHTFITAYYNTINIHSIDNPSPTVTPVDRFALVNYNFIDNQYGNGSSTPTDHPCTTLTITPKQKLIFINQFLMNPQYNNTCNSIDNPCFTLVARMDKCPPYLITTNEGNLGIAIFESDSPMTVKIKQVMALYNIVDIKMRMLHIAELKRIQGFPDSYILHGTQAQQKKFLGNAVEVNMSRVLCEALASELRYSYRMAI